jgi:hypothetical protein
MDSITYSAIAKFLTCPRAYKHSYEDWLRPLITPTALSFGSQAHTALEKFYKGLPPDHCLVIRDLDHIDTVKLRAMMRAYFELHKEEEFTPEEVEWEFEAPIINPATRRKSRTFHLRGKIDGLVNKHGDRWLLEHKTATRIPQAKELDFQTILYTYACGCNAKPISGVIHNYMIKTTSQPRKGESLGDFEKRIQDMYTSGDKFHRIHEHRVYQHINKIMGTVWWVMQQINQCRKTNQWTQNFTACRQYQRDCDYLPLCVSGSMSAAHTLYRVAKSKHEELNNAAT